MLLNADDLPDLNTGYSAAYAKGAARVTPTYQRIATTVPSTGPKQSYPWLGDLPDIREWIGDRYHHKLAQHDYTIRNKGWEMTVDVDRDAVDDDTFGVYAPLMENLGYSVARFPDKLCYGLLASGWTDLCYDGQAFFDADHPGYDETGAETSVSNSGGGSGEPWFMIDASRPLLPLVYQLRKPFTFGLLEGSQPTAPVPRSRVLSYGSNGRCNVGYGMWHTAYGSKEALDATNYKAARLAMSRLCKRDGSPMGIIPNLLVVGPSNRDAAEAILVAGGATNPLAGSMELHVSEWLR